MPGTCILAISDLVHSPQLLVREHPDSGLVMLEPHEKLPPLEHLGGLGGSTKELTATGDIQGETKDLHGTADGPLGEVELLGLDVLADSGHGLNLCLDVIKDVVHELLVVPI